METLIKRVQEQLDNNWCVSADDIQEMVDILKSLSGLRQDIANTLKRNQNEKR